MRVLLISSNVAESPYPIYPLGLSMIAGGLSSAGHEVRQMDYLRESSSLDAIERVLLEFDPGLVGISIRNIDNVNFMNNQCYIGHAGDIVRKIKSVSPVKVILGGAGFSLMPEQILKATGADYGVVGEGEAVVVEFADNAERGIYPKEPLMMQKNRLCGLEIPGARYDDSLMEFYLKNGNCASVQTKRGCTSRCVYCSYPLLEGQAIRTRDIGAVLDDLEMLRDRHKCKYVFLVDSVFNDDGDEYLELVREMIRRDVQLPWTGFFKPRGIDDTAVKLMKQAGLIGVEIGSDAATDTTLKRLGKNFTFEEIRKFNDMFADNGIPCAHFYMFGGPGETAETVSEGIANILSLKNCVVFIYAGIRILPNTPLEQLALKEGVITTGTNLLEPVYYFSPSVDAEWMQETLKESFSNVRHCIYPPDSMDGSLTMLHELGHTGILWDLLLTGRKRKRNAGKS